MSDTVPLGWASINLFDICQPSQWKTISISDLLPDGYTVYGANGVIGFYDKYTHEKPTIMITCRGATCGNIHVSKPFSYINGNAMALDGLVEELCHLKYLESFLQFRNFQDVISGSAQPQITRASLQIVSIPLAPYKEQTRIVEKLEELLTDLDTATNELKTAQKKLTQYRQSLLKAAVEGALTAEWRANNTPNESGSQLLERILKERRARWEQKQVDKFNEQGKTPPKDWQSKYSEPVKPDTKGLMELPDGWVWTCIGQSFHVAVGATPSRKEPTYWNGDIPWVSSGEVRFTHITDTKEKISADGLKNSSTNINPIGSVLLGMIGEGKTRGQVSILDIEAANNQNCAAIWTSETDIPSEYVYYWLWSRYEETRKGSSGNNQPALNKSIVEKIPMPLPPVAELEQLTQFLSIALDGIANQEKFIEHSLKQSAAQRKNILKAAFSGQLVPQDPNDEPASVLLERIKAERVAQEVTKKPRQRSNA